ncbi:MAG: hypothetical protein LBF64_06450, partial [Oscillospiraceae bacterium]|nr:hypothetical protein [Oscillospiraceae bacterium]
PLRGNKKQEFFGDRSHPRFAEFISANRTPRGASAPRSNPSVVEKQSFSTTKQEFGLWAASSPR